MRISQRTPVFLLLSATIIVLLSGCAPKADQDTASEAAGAKTGTPNPQFPAASDAEYARRYNNSGPGGRH